eukprot:tig00020675_g12589.t1
MNRAPDARFAAIGAIAAAAVAWLAARAYRSRPCAKPDLSNLFQPFKLGSLELSNRIVMAPMTRCFANEKGLVPTDDMAAYYERRAELGLIITEGTIIRADAQGYPRTPGIYSKEQIAGWKKVTDRVHAKGGKIFCQLWHCGRAGHKFFTGMDPVCPSAVALEGRVPRTQLQYETPHALTLKEIPDQIDSWRHAAAAAKEAGFDGVEIHGANGYLLDQFLHKVTNQRTDAYGGTPEKAIRFVLEAVDATIKGFGDSRRVGIRLSPSALFNMTHTAGDEETFKLLLKELEKRDLAYVHEGTFDDNVELDYLGGRASAFLRKNYKGTVIGCGAYSAESGAAALKDGKFDLVCIGRPVLANPNYAQLVREGRLSEIVPMDNSMHERLH